MAQHHHAHKRRRFDPFSNPDGIDPLGTSLPQAPARSSVVAWGTGFADLSQELHALAAYVQPTEEEERARRDLFERVRGLLAAASPGCRCEAFGSWPSGLSAFDGDLDLAMLGGDSGFDLAAVGFNLRCEGWVEQVEHVAHARVPIVTFRDSRSGLSVDLGLASEGSRATRAFLERCARRHAAFRPVCLLLKLLLGQLRLHKAFHGGVSSYRVYVLVAHMLECRPGCAAMAAGPLLLATLEHFGRTVDWQATTSVSADGGREVAHFSGAAFKMFEVVDALGAALRALHGVGASLRGVLDAAALARAREASRAAFQYRAAFFGGAPRAADAPLLGRRVAVHGLSGRPELNGRCGVARRYDEARGRYEVELEAGGGGGGGGGGGSAAEQSVLLRAANLQPPDADADDAGSGGGGGGGGGGEGGEGGASRAGAPDGRSTAGAPAAAAATAAPNATAETWKASGDAASKEGDSERAWGCYAAALGSAAGAADAGRQGGEAFWAGEARWLAAVYGNRSAAGLSLGCASQALSDARRCVRHDERWAKAHARLAAAQRARGDADGAAAAAAAYARALALEPSGASCARWREALGELQSGRSHADALEGGGGGAGAGGAGRPREAARAAAGAAADGGAERADEAKARGNAAFQAARHAEAAGIYTRALGRLEAAGAAAAALGGGRERAVLLSNRCAALVALGVVRGEALADARGAVLADPTFAKGHLRLGTALLDGGDAAAAIDALEAGLAVEPANAQLRAALERAVTALGSGK